MNQNEKPNLIAEIKALAEDASHKIVATLQDKLDERHVFFAQQLSNLYNENHYGLDVVPIRQIRASEIRARLEIEESSELSYDGSGCVAAVKDSETDKYAEVVDLKDADNYDYEGLHEDDETRYWLYEFDEDDEPNDGDGFASVDDAIDAFAESILSALTDEDQWTVCDEAEAEAVVLGDRTDGMFAWKEDFSPTNSWVIHLDDPNALDNAKDHLEEVVNHFIEDKEEK